MNQQPQPQLNLTLPVQAVDLILAGLSKLPLEQSMDTFIAVRQQAMSQLNPAPAPDAPEAPTAPAPAEQ